MANLFARRMEYEKRMHESGRHIKVKTERLIKGWRSDWTRAELAAFFKVNRKTITYWAQKYGLKYRSRSEQTALRNYALRLTRAGILQITVPRYVAKKLELKAGDRLRFEPKEDKCFLRKETNETPAANRPFAVERAEPHKKDETGRPRFNLKKLPRRISRQRRERLLAGWHSDWTARPLARKLGVPIYTIYYWARRYGLTYRRYSAKYKKEDLLAKWKSDLTSEKLAARLGMTPWAIYYWAHKYGSAWDRWGMLSRRSYSLQETGRRGYQIRMPQYIVNKMNLKAGDRMRFELKNNACVLSKEKETAGRN